MIKHIRKIIVIAIAICSFSSNQILADTNKLEMPINNPTPPKINAKSYLLVDYNSEHFLADKNADQKVEPASLTKMMTMYVIDTELKNKKISLDDKVLISHKARHIEGSRMFLEEGKRALVADLIKGIIIQSGNDASIAMAEHIAGSEQAFADIMNAQAANLGMQNTNFVNSTGIPAKNHYTTARDMAILAKALIRDFPDSYDLYSKKEFSYNNIKQQNRNPLLWRTNYVDGIKTGQAESAGFCIVASGKQNDMRLIAVVLGAKSLTSRASDTHTLLTWGFRFFETHKLYSLNTILKDLPVYMGQTNNIALGLANNLYITIPRGYKNKLNINISLPKNLKAPIEKNEAFGTYEVIFDNKMIAEEPIIALNSIEKGGIWRRVKDGISLNISSLIDKVWS